MFVVRSCLFLFLFMFFCFIYVLFFVFYIRLYWFHWRCYCMSKKFNTISMTQINRFHINFTACRKNWCWIVCVFVYVCLCLFYLFMFICFFFFLPFSPSFNQPIRSATHSSPSFAAWNFPLFFKTKKNK